MNYGKIYLNDVINGEGLRVSLFVSGCTIHCPGCFNKEAQDFNYGKPFTINEENKIINQLNNDKIKYKGLSILGGEPFDNAEELIPFVERVKFDTKDKDIWIWSGYTEEQILKDNIKRELYNLCDYAVLGPFIENLKDLSLKFRGSSNQKIIKIHE